MKLRFHLLSSKLFEHRVNLTVEKVCTEISIKCSIVLLATEPTVLPFLGSRRLPFDILSQGNPVDPQKGKTVDPVTDC